MGSFLTGVAAGLAIAMPPGAIATLIIQTGLQRGFRPALAAGLGCATVDLCYASIAVFLGAALVPLLGAAEPALRVAAGVVLIAIGGVGLLGLRRPSVAAPQTTTTELLRTYLRFVALTLVNPATLAYFIAIALGIGRAVLADAPAFVAGVALATATWQSGLALVSGSLHGRLRASARGAIATLANGVVIALGIGILAQVIAG
ncbi:MAG: LysE family transporter [Candidatus Limnocylindria bacterium]